MEIEDTLISQSRWDLESVSSAIRTVAYYLVHITFFFFPPPLPNSPNFPTEPQTRSDPLLRGVHGEG